MSGTVGWVHVNKSEFTDYNDWRSQAGFGLSAGWYWTDHHVTRVGVTGTTTATLYAPVTIVVNSLPVFVSTRRSFSTRRLGIVQQYQFRRNEWVHPFLGAGVDVVWERLGAEDDPVYVFDQVTRQSRLTRNAVNYPVRTEVAARGVLTGGVKAYMSRKAFALTDLRVSIGRGRTEDAEWRFGLGVDF